VHKEHRTGETAGYIGVLPNVKKKSRHLFQGTAPPPSAEFRETVERYLWPPWALLAGCSVNIALCTFTAHIGRYRLGCCQTHKQWPWIALELQSASRTRTESGVHVKATIRVAQSV